jgi:hypothetical protein
MPNRVDVLKDLDLPRKQVRMRRPSFRAGAYHGIAVFANTRTCVLQRLPSHVLEEQRRLMRTSRRAGSLTAQVAVASSPWVRARGPVATGQSPARRRIGATDELGQSDRLLGDDGNGAAP